MVKVGLIGLGNWGRKLLPKLDQICEVVSCSNRTDSNSYEWLSVNFPSISHTFDYTAILNDSEIEAVVITTPIVTHAALVHESLDAGKHVFVEKPLATNSSTVRNFFDKAKKNELGLFVGYIYFFHPILERLSKINAEDNFHSINMSWEKCGSFEESIIWNLATHELSIIYKLFGSSVERVISRENSRDRICFKLIFNSDRHVSVTIDRNSSIRKKIVTLEAKSGSSYIWENKNLYYSEKGKDSIILHSDDTDILEIELNKFIENITSKTFDYNESLNHFVTENLLNLESQSNASLV